MRIPGRPFEIEIDQTEDTSSEAAVPKANLFDLVGEIRERNDPERTPSAPTPPSQKNAGVGFPAHKKRAFLSRFKAQKQEAAEAPGRSMFPPDVTERQQIDNENRDRLARMSQSDIAEMKQDLVASLNPRTLEKLLARSYIDEPGQPTDFPGLEPEAIGQVKAGQEGRTGDAGAEKKESTPKRVSFAPAPAPAPAVNAKPTADINEALTSVAGSTSNETRNHSTFAESEAPSMHWPKPSQPPSLDPSAPTFLDDLHSKYFPDLATEPEKLEWMKERPGESVYECDAAGVDPKNIRFSFSGSLIPPKLAAEIPVTAGLHHHGEAPDAAGYTIAELGILARSSVAAQRCMAFQTLGRILFRLGKGEFGNPSEDRPDVERADQMGELARGLWDEVQMHAVIDICVAESEGQGPGKGRHASARAYATEAVWLWQKGGGRRWTAA